MRLILSRKGFDSAAGGVPSPILDDGPDDGAMLSLPIPDRHSGTEYRELAWRGRSLGAIVEELSRGRVKARHGAHLDPDLDPTLRARADGWRPSLGQCGAAQSALARRGVGPGDLFLFFGWFRRATERDGELAYVRGAPDLHVLFGWLQIGEVLDDLDDHVPAWAVDHPHVVDRERVLNTIYVGAERVELGGEALDVPGGGVFGRYDERRRLTAPEARTRSLWAVPEWLEPRGRTPLGYHERADRWRRTRDGLRLQSVARGQELVLDLDEYPEALPWLRGLLG